MLNPNSGFNIMSLSCDVSEFAWVERYRPKTVKECILKKKTKEQFLDIVDKGHIQNMLLFGHPGSGKTTVAKALCLELGLDWMIINASNERGLDVIRDHITSFCSTVSLSGNGKCFILDEADHLLPATQAALRNATEEFSKYCSFIMTANYPNRIIEPLHSRFVGIDFNAEKSELLNMQAEFYGRVTKILKNEKVEWDDKVLIRVIQKFFPDNRRILNLLQNYGRHGMIDEGILMEIEEISIDVFIEAIKNKKFKEVTQFAVDQSNNDTSMIYQKLYRGLNGIIKPNCIPDVIQTLEDYQRYDAIVPSKELHIAALGTELIMMSEFK